MDQRLADTPEVLKFASRQDARDLACDGLLALARDPIPYGLETDWLAGAAGFEPLHCGIEIP